jgi:hypothetical protein
MANALTKGLEALEAGVAIMASGQKTILMEGRP